MITRAGMTAYSTAMEEYFQNQYSDKKGSGNVYAGGDVKNTVVNYANGTRVVTGSDDDTITSVAGGVIIDSQDGDDSIIAIGNGTEINSGAGDDKIYVQGNNVDIEKGTGADEIYITGSNINFAENKDDVADTIKTPGFTFQYIKNQGLILDPLYVEEPEEDEETEEEFDTVINIYQ